METAPRSLVLTMKINKEGGAVVLGPDFGGVINKDGTTELLKPAAVGGGEQADWVASNLQSARTSCGHHKLPVCEVWWSVLTCGNMFSQKTAWVFRFLADSARPGWLRGAPLRQARVTPTQGAIV